MISNNLILKYFFMKKTFFYIFAIASSLLVACNKEYVKTDSDVAERIQVSVSTSTPFTKATTPDEVSESKIRTLEVLVFRKDGILDGYAKSSSGTPNNVTVSCTKGIRDVYAVVNSDTDLSTISTKDDLLATSSYLKNNSRTNGFVMVGNIADESFTSSTSLNVPVHRLASRVRVKKIMKSLESPALQAMEFKIIDIYLTNVVNKFNFGETFVPDGAEALWYNRCTYLDENKTEKDEMTFRSVSSLGSAGVVDSYVDLNASYSLYAYPNPIDNTESSTTWSARNTKWVLKCSLNGKVGYVHFKLPVLEPNKSYEVDNLIINHRPTDNEIDDFEALNITAQVTVSDWDLVKLGTSENGIVKF